MNSDSKSSQPSQGNSPDPDTPRDSGPGATRTTLGKYKLGQRLGAGGMGWVYLAFDTERKHSVALKVLPRSKAANPVLVQRFKSEAKAASQLGHPNIVRIYEAGEADGYLYIALEYFKGTDVHNLVGRLGVLPVRRSIEMVRQMADALDHAFEKAIVHRDIKPANLLVSRDGTVKLADLGLARSMDETDDASLTRAGTTVGTVDYMAPEQARNSRAADVRSDIYSLGCTWYHMLTGEPPFPGGSLTNKLFAHVSSARPDPRAKNAAISTEVVNVMHKMMARKPKDRYQTPTELLEALDNISDDDGIVVIEDDEEDLNFERTLSDSLGRETSSEMPAMSTPLSVRIPTRRSSSTNIGSIWDHVHGGHIAVGLIVTVIFGILYWALIRFGGTEGHDIVAMNVMDDPTKNAAAVPAPTTENADASKTNLPGANPQPGVAPPGGNPPQNDVGPAPPGKAPSVPEWTQTIWPENGAEAPPIVTVGREDGNPAAFTDLADALDEVPATGRTVELAGPGPFALSPLQIAGAAKVVLKGSANARPIVVCVGERNARADSVLHIAGGTLVLENLDIIFAGDSFDESHPVAVADVSDGNLVVRNCSITLDGPRKSALTAFRISGAAGSQSAPKVLLDRTFFRGDPLCPLSVVDAPVDLVARDCLFVTGRTPIVQAAGSASGEGKAARAFRFFDCSATVQQTAFQLTHGSSSTTDNTAIECVNSVFACQSQTDGRVLLTLVDFPPSTSQSGSDAGLRVAANDSVFAGWNELVRSQPDASVRVQGPAQWERYWQASTVSLRFPSTQWPSAPIRDFAAIQPADFDASSLNVEGAGAGVGCDVSQLHTFASEWLPRARNLAYRPIAPPQISGQEPTKTVGIQLSQDDLGSVISNTDWPNGTEFVVTGAGSHRSSPVRVANKSFRIRFHGAARRYAEIVPKPSDQSAAGDEADGALIFVKNGNVEIDGANFRIASSGNRATATRVLKVTNGNFAIRNSSLIGPPPATPKFEGLIEWMRPDQQQGIKLSAGIYQQHAEIESSFLTAPSALFVVDGRGFGLSISDSLLVSLDNIFQIELSGQGADVISAIDVDRSTLSAGNRFFDINFGPAMHPGSPTIRVFASETLFAPPVPTSPARGSNAIVIAVPEAAWAKQKLLWWGNRNGFAEQIATFTVDRTGSAPADRSDFEAAWGRTGSPHSDAYSIWHPEEVALKTPPADALKIIPSEFAVEKTAKAAKWAIDGGTIGVDVASLIMPDPEAKSIQDDPAEEKLIESRPKETSPKIGPRPQTKSMGAPAKPRRHRARAKH